MATFQTKKLSECTATAAINADEYLIKVDNTGVVTRIKQDALLAGTTLHSIYSVPEGSRATNVLVSQHIATPEVAGNQDIHFILFSSPSYGNPEHKQGVVLQEVSDRRTTQYMFWDGRVSIRAIHFTRTSRDTVMRVDNWVVSGLPIGFKVEGNQVKMKCVHGDAFGEAIPLATTSEAGLMSREDKAKIADLERRIAALEKK